MYKKTTLLTLFLFFMSVGSLLAKDDQQVSTTVIGNGIGIGSALAIAICWSRTHSVITSILAGIFGWLYVIYYCLIRENK